jgi:hypothetical protein
MTQTASDQAQVMLEEELEHIPAGDPGSHQRKFRDAFRKLRLAGLRHDLGHDAMDAVEQAAYQVRQAAGDRELDLVYDRGWFVVRW